MNYEKAEFIVNSAFSYILITFVYFVKIVIVKDD